MSVARYLWSAAAGIALGLLGAVLCAGVVRASGGGMELALLVGVLAAAFPGAALAWDYCRKHAFYKGLVEFSEGDEDLRWFFELVKRPDFAEGAAAFDVIAAIDKGANDRISAADRRVLEYREYVEAWVHEAKSPLSAAHLMVDNLRAESTAAPEGGASDASARLAALDNELARVERSIEQALFYARSETLDRDYIVGAFTLHDLVAQALKDNARLLIAAHVSPRLGALDQEVFTDGKWMRFILGQVIQNSAKYARAEGAELHFEGRLVDAGLATERVELAVADNGRGVSVADLPRVFDKGFTGDAGRAGGNATGIGLYLVKRLCGKMGVSVFATSVQGASFTVTFGFSTNRYSHLE